MNIDIDIDKLEQRVRLAMRAEGHTSPSAIPPSDILALIERVRDAEQEVRSLSELLKAAGEDAKDIKEENAALAAHVERLEALLYCAQLGLRWFRDQHPDEDTEVDAEFDAKIAAALQGGLTTSLARFKAKWQAEALEEAASETERRHGYMLGTTNPLELRRMAADKRRQAEETKS